MGEARTKGVGWDVGSWLWGLLLLRNPDDADVVWATPRGICVWWWVGLGREGVAWRVGRSISFLLCLRHLDNWEVVQATLGIRGRAQQGCLGHPGANTSKRPHPITLPRNFTTPCPTTSPPVHAGFSQYISSY